MKNSTDAILARYSGEIEDRTTFLDSLVEKAQEEEKDLTAQEMELIGQTRDRISSLNDQVAPLREAATIAAQSRERTEQISQQLREAKNPEKPLEYRSAGEYVLDRWKAGLGMDEAVNRLDLFHRAAAHQTTSDNPGLLPEQIIGPVINFVDETRPLTTALGPRQLPSGSWSRPRVTQHTNVAAQGGEKTELVSRKMTISKLPVTATTYGGYVNISRQDVDWTAPSVMDLVINDLAGYYAQVTEDALGDVLSAAATAGTDLPATPTGADVSGAIWAAAAAVYTACKGQGSLIIAAPPDMLGLIGPLFAPVNPQNAQSSGFNAGQFGSGIMGAISGVQVIVSNGLAANSLLVMSSAAGEVYEDRIGSLQVVEPSVLGVQVAYAGYFAPLVIEAGGIVKIAR